MKNGEGEEDYWNRLFSWISNKFVGYSVSHVQGRFRGYSLLEFDDFANQHQDLWNEYIVDETTAIVRFIFPVGIAKEDENREDNYWREIFLPSNEEKKTDEEAELVRWLFYQLFVASIIELVSGEDEIWVLESGIRNKLHIWRNIA